MLPDSGVAPAALTHPPKLADADPDELVADDLEGWDFLKETTTPLPHRDVGAGERSLPPMSSASSAAFLSSEPDAAGGSRARNRPVKGAHTVQLKKKRV